MMENAVEFSYKEKRNPRLSTKFHFIITQRIESCEHRIHFHTFEDISGFGMDAPIISNPYDFVTLGIAIIAEKEFIREEIKKHLRD